MPGDQIKKELVIIDSLLRSKEFAYEVATILDSAYSGGKQQNMITPEEETATIAKTVREEKIAINLAGFYAVECGIGLLCERTKSGPVEWLKKITQNEADADAILLLNRFANATWKAGQPFRGLDRISRYNFTGACYLSSEEIEKDVNQIIAASSLLLEHMLSVEKEDTQEQMGLLKKLLQDEHFAVTIATFINASYHTSQHQVAPLFLTAADDREVIKKSVNEEKIATNMAGFYALECGVNYLVTINNVAPSDILRSIENDSINEADKTLLLRFANATWKAGQPFRGLDRIRRDVFTPVYYLSKEEIEKDMVQIRAAARKLLQEIENR